MSEEDDDRAERLRDARRLAGYNTAVEAAEALRIAYPTYAGHENGSRDFRRHAARYARAFRVNLTWLVTGVGSPKSKGSASPIMELFEALPPEKQSQAIDFLEYLGQEKE